MRASVSASRINSSCSRVIRSAARRRACNSSARGGFSMKSSAPLSSASAKLWTLLAEDMVMMCRGRRSSAISRTDQHSSSPLIGRTSRLVMRTRTSGVSSR